MLFFLCNYKPWHTPLPPPTRWLGLTGWDRWDMMLAGYYLVCFVNSSLFVDQRTFFCATLQLFPSAAESLGKQFLYITKLNWQFNLRQRSQSYWIAVQFRPFKKGTVSKSHVLFSIECSEWACRRPLACDTRIENRKSAQNIIALLTFLQSLLSLFLLGHFWISYCLHLLFLPTGLDGVDAVEQTLVKPVLHVIRGLTLSLCKKVEKGQTSEIPRKLYVTSGHPCLTVSTYPPQYPKSQKARV